MRCTLVRLEGALTADFAAIRAFIRYVVSVECNVTKSGIARTVPVCFVVDSNGTGIDILHNKGQLVAQSMLLGESLDWQGEKRVMRSDCQRKTHPSPPRPIFLAMKHPNSRTLQKGIESVCTVIHRRRGIRCLAFRIIRGCRDAISVCPHGCPRLSSPTIERHTRFLICGVLLGWIQGHPCSAVGLDKDGITVALAVAVTLELIGAEVPGQLSVAITVESTARYCDDVLGGHCAARKA